MTREDGFLGRWSKRKLAEPEARTEEDMQDPAGAAPDPAVDADAEPEKTEPEKTDAELLEDLGLPDPDVLKQGDDFSGFMDKAVPTRLRNRALRRLWLSNPALANLDELVDYGQDFTDAAMVVENMQTAYQVGKGWLKDVPEESEDAESDDAESDDTESDDAESGDAESTDDVIATDPEESPEGDAVAAGSESNDAALHPDTAASDLPDRQNTELAAAPAGPAEPSAEADLNDAAREGILAEASDAPLSPRRMRFHFDGA